MAASGHLEWCQTIVGRLIRIQFSPGSFRRKFTALDLDLLMAIASRVRDKGTGVFDTSLSDFLASSVTTEPDSSTRGAGAPPGTFSGSNSNSNPTREARPRPGFFFRYLRCTFRFSRGLYSPKTSPK